MKLFWGIWLAVMAILGVIGSLFWFSGFGRPDAVSVPTYFYEPVQGSPQPAQDRLPN